MRPRMTMSMGRPPRTSGQSRVLLAPGLRAPRRSRGSSDAAIERAEPGQRVQVVDVVAVRGDDRVVALRDQDQFAVAHREGLVDAAVGGVDLLDRVAFGTVDPVVVDLFEVDLAGRIVDIVLVRRIAGPVAAGRVDLQISRRCAGKSGLSMWLIWRVALPPPRISTPTSAGVISRAGWDSSARQ